MIFIIVYLETLQAVDESIERVMELGRKTGTCRTIRWWCIWVIMDFSFGEHGLIDKRHAYEESMRVPLLVWAPGMIKPNSVVEQIIMNVDLAPTFLEMAGIAKPSANAGTILLPILLKGKNSSWNGIKYFTNITGKLHFRKHRQLLLYVSDRYKYISYNGIWDINELYDLENDPYEMNNLIRNKDMDTTGLLLRDGII